MTTWQNSRATAFWSAWRRRTIRVHSKYGYDKGKGYPTTLEVYPDQVRLTQDRGLYKPGLLILDPPGMKSLIKLWLEVKEKIQQ